MRIALYMDTMRPGRSTGRSERGPVTAGGAPGPALREKRKALNRRRAESSRRPRPWERAVTGRSQPFAWSLSATCLAQPPTTPSSMTSELPPDPAGVFGGEGGGSGVGAEDSCEEPPM